MEEEERPKSAWLRALAAEHLPRCPCHARTPARRRSYLSVLADATYVTNT